MKLSPNPTLVEIQSYIQDMEIKRGYENETIRDQCMLLTEEVGELCKAVRRSEGFKIDPNSTKHEIADELADIFIYLCAIANKKNINLEKAFRDKEAKNKQRTWE